MGENISTWLPKYRLNLQGVAKLGLLKTWLAK